MARAMGLKLARDDPGRRWLAAAAKPAGGQAGAANKAPNASIASIAPNAQKAAQSPNAPNVAQAATAAAPPSAMSRALDAGRDHIQQGLGSGTLRLNDVLQRALATLHEALACRAVVLCLRDGASGRLVGRVALGPLPAALFEVTPAAQGDLLAVVSARAVDTLIDDAAAVAKRMPPWWQSRVCAGSFLVLPMVLKGAAIGLIYADCAEAGALQPSAAELGSVRALRDAVVAAFAAGPAPGPGAGAASSRRAGQAAGANLQR
jgi:hypothetical protein